MGPHGVPLAIKKNPERDGGAFRGLQKSVVFLFMTCIFWGVEAMIRSLKLKFKHHLSIFYFVLEVECSDDWMARQKNLEC